MSMEGNRQLLQYSWVKDKVNKDAACTIRNQKRPAKDIAGYVAFWKGVE